LFEPVLELKQRLPDLKAMAAEPESIEIAAQAEEDKPHRKPIQGKSARKSPVRKKPGKV